MLDQIIQAKITRQFSLLFLQINNSERKTKSGRTCLGTKEALPACWSMLVCGWAARAQSLSLPYSKKSLSLGREQLLAGCPAWPARHLGHEPRPVYAPPGKPSACGPLLCCLPWPGPLARLRVRCAESSTSASVCSAPPCAR